MITDSHRFCNAEVHASQILTSFSIIGIFYLIINTLSMGQEKQSSSTLKCLAIPTQFFNCWKRTIGQLLTIVACMFSTYSSLMSCHLSCHMSHVSFVN